MQEINHLAKQRVRLTITTAATTNDTLYGEIVLKYRIPQYLEKRPEAGLLNVGEE